MWIPRTCEKCGEPLVRSRHQDDHLFCIEGCGGLVRASDAWRYALSSEKHAKLKARIELAEKVKALPVAVSTKKSQQYEIGGGVFRVVRKAKADESPENKGGIIARVGESLHRVVIREFIPLEPTHE